MISPVILSSKTSIKDCILCDLITLISASIIIIVKYDNTVEYRNEKNLSHACAASANPPCLFFSKDSADKAEMEGQDGSQGLENVVKKWWHSLQRR